MGRFVYVDDEVVEGYMPGLNDVQPSSSSEAQDDVSSIGEWTTDSGMPRGPSSESQASVGARSIAALSFAGSIRSVNSYKGSEVKEDGSWELGVLLMLVGVGCMLLGVVCTLGCFRLRGASTSHAGATVTDSSELQGVGTPSGQGTAGDVDNVDMRAHVNSSSPLQFSPVVNITLQTGSVRTVGGLSSSESIEKESSASDRLSRSFPVDPRSGLGPGCTLGAEVEERGVGGGASASPVGPPSGLDPGWTLGVDAKECAAGGGAEVLHVGPPSGLDTGWTLDVGAEGCAAGGEKKDSSVGPPCGLDQNRFPGAEVRHRCAGDVLETFQSVCSAAESGGNGGAHKACSLATEDVDMADAAGSQVHLKTSGALRQRRAVVDEERCNSHAGSLGASASAGVPPAGAEDVGFPPVPPRPRGFPEDWVRRPRGVKQSVILSCAPNSPGPLLLVTQHGDCVHSGRDCRPMQCSGMPIQRRLCQYCFSSGVLPARFKGADRTERNVYFTKSGHFVHDVPTCPAISTREEVIHRRFCKCCRWG